MALWCSFADTALAESRPIGCYTLAQEFDTVGNHAYNCASLFFIPRATFWRRMPLMRWKGAGENT